MLKIPTAKTIIRLFKLKKKIAKINRKQKKPMYFKIDKDLKRKSRENRGNVSKNIEDINDLVKQIKCISNEIEINNIFISKMLETFSFLDITQILA